MTRRTFLCRCEDVTLSEVEKALSHDLTSIEEIKRYTGLGTGPCQGKECLAATCRLLVERGVASADAVAPFTPRPPCEPVSFAALAALGEGLVGHVADGYGDEGSEL